jgi:hypothetical protein
MAIYYLDIDDEVTSAAARIRDASDTRIALVLTAGARVATSRINFRLLAGEARRRSKRLAIVTADPTTQSVARSAGLPVFATVGEYERAEQTRAAGKPDDPDGVSEALDELAATVVVRPGGGAGRASASGSRTARGSGGLGRAGSARVPWRLTAAAGFVAVAALAAGLFFIYPSATVTLTVTERQVGPVAFEATVDPNATSADNAAGVVPGLSKAFPLESSGTYDATGQKINETASGGSVTFDSINTIFAVPVLAGTRVSTAGGIAFTTTQTINIPKATVSGSRITHGKASVAVNAAVPGTAGNVAAGTIVKLPSDLATAGVSVTNPQATSGGTHTVTPIVAQADVDAAVAELMATLKSDFNDAVSAPDAAPSGATLFAISAKLGITIFSPDPQSFVGTEAATFDLHAAATGTAIVADLGAVERLAASRVAASVDAGFTLANDSVTSSLGTAELRDGSVVIPVSAGGREARKLDENALRAAIKGRSLEEARAYLAQFGTVQIAVSPGWASTMPSFDFRIEFNLVEATTEPTATAGSSGSSGSAQTAAVPRKTAAPARTAAASASASVVPSIVESPQEPASSVAPSAGPTG